VSTFLYSDHAQRCTVFQGTRPTNVEHVSFYGSVFFPKPLNLFVETFIFMLRLTYVALKTSYSGTLNTTLRSARWAELAARMGGIRNAYKSLVGKPEGK